MQAFLVHPRFHHSAQFNAETIWRDKASHTEFGPSESVLSTQIGSSSPTSRVTLFPTASIGESVKWKDPSGIFLTGNAGKEVWAWTRKLVWQTSAQRLNCIPSPRPMLYCWSREKKGSRHWNLSGNPKEFSHKHTGIQSEWCCGRQKLLLLMQTCLK